MRNRNRIAGFIAALVISVVAIGIPVLLPEFQSSATLGQSEKRGVEESEATSIQEGVMTDKQRQHSKLFKGYYDASWGKKIPDLVREKGDTEIRREVGDMIVPRNLPLHDYLANLACNADLVVLGTVNNKSSQVADEGTFLFTDYEFSVESVLKDNSATPVVGNSVITITRAGGAVKLNGHIVRAIDFSQRPLLRGKQYLLFLRFIPATGAYKHASNWAEDTFQIVDNQIAQVSGRPVPLGTERKVDVTLFIGEVKNVVAGACKN